MAGDFAVSRYDVAPFAGSVGCGRPRRERQIGFMAGHRIGDIATDDDAVIGTQAMGNAVIGT